MVHSGGDSILGWHHNFLQSVRSGKLLVTILHKNGHGPFKIFFGGGGYITQYKHGLGLGFERVLLGNLAQFFKQFATSVKGTATLQPNKALGGHGYNLGKRGFRHDGVC